MEKKSIANFNDVPLDCRQVIGGFLDLKALTRYNSLNKITTQTIQNSERVRSNKHMSNEKIFSKVPQEDWSVALSNTFKFCSKYSDTMTLCFICNTPFAIMRHGSYVGGANHEIFQLIKLLPERFKMGKLIIAFDADQKVYKSITDYIQRLPLEFEFLRCELRIKSTINDAAFCQALLSNQQLRNDCTRFYRKEDIHFDFKLDAGEIHIGHTDFLLDRVQGAKIMTSRLKTNQIYQIGTLFDPQSIKQLWLKETQFDSAKASFIEQLTNLEILVYQSFGTGLENVNLLSEETTLQKFFAQGTCEDLTDFSILLRDWNPKKVKQTYFSSLHEKYVVYVPTATGSQFKFLLEKLFPKMTIKIFDTEKQKFHFVDNQTRHELIVDNSTTFEQFDIFN